VADDNIAFVMFFEGWEQGGVSGDGLPLFHEVVKIRKSVPPYTEITRIATEQDIEDFPVQFGLFRKEQAGRHPEVEGYPLALWPAISPADFQNCAARDIVTVEQLAQLANRRSDGGNAIPPPILELAKRAKKMVELQKEVGRFEALITQLTADRDALAEDLKEANATISAQNGMINMLRTKAA
jgi:hypothetical protein